MRLSPRQEAILDLRSWQQFHQSNPNYLDWDLEERHKHNAKLVKAMRVCGLDAGDTMDAIAWMNTADAGKKVERLRDELREASPDATAEKLAKIESTIAELSMKSKGGRPAIETEADYLKRLKKYEREVIKLSKDNEMSASAIDQLMKERRLTINKDGDETTWTHGTAKGILDKYTKWKKRRDSATK